MRKLIPYLLLVLVLAALILLAPSLVQGITINRRSLTQQARASQEGLNEAGLADLAGHPREPYWRAIAAQKAGDPQAVLPILQPLLNTGDGFARQIAAQAYEDSGDLQSAAGLWAQLGIGPNLQRIADTALASGDLDTARVALAALFELSPNEGTISLARFLEQTAGDPAAAEEVYQQGIDRIAVSRYKPYIIADYARFLERQGRWADAAGVHKQVIDSIDLFYPSERNPDRRYAALASAQLNAGQVSAAVASIEEAVRQAKLGSDRPLEIYNLAGQIYEAANQLGAARQAYRQALRIDPGNRTALEALQRLRTP